MCDLHQRIFVACPPHDAAGQVTTFFRDRQPLGQGAKELQPVSLALRPPVMLPALRTAIVLQRDIVVTLTLLPEAGEALVLLRVDWEPAGGGPFPRFHGTIRAASNEGYEGFCLVLDGAYDPPLGVLETVDSDVGHRIAVATARSLLGEVRDAVEHSYKAYEFAKEARRAGAERLGPAQMPPA